MHTHVVFFGPGNPSTSKQVLQDVLPLLQQQGTVDVLDLATDLPTLFTPSILQTYVSRNLQGGEIDAPELNKMDEFTERLQAADLLVMIFPMYNYFLPSNVKAWLDNVMQSKKTFKHTEFGPEGLLTANNAIIVHVSGGTLQNSARDFTTPYMDFILKFMGIINVYQPGIFGTRFNKYEHIKPTFLQEFEKILANIKAQ